VHVSSSDGLQVTLLEERQGTEILFGQIARPWKPITNGDDTPDIRPAQLTASTDPGYAKIAFSIRVEPNGGDERW
jgi:hypothetical protein